MKKKQPSELNEDIGQRTAEEAQSYWDDVPTEIEKLRLVEMHQPNMLFHTMFYVSL